MNEGIKVREDIMSKNEDRIKKLKEKLKNMKERKQTQVNKI